MKRFKFALFAVLSVPLFAADAALRDLVAKKLDADYASLEALYRHFHANPELSLMEEKTSAKLAAELRAAGYEVTEGVGGYGVVAVLKNGPGPTVLVRGDMDALPVEEETGLPYASKVRTKDLTGREVPVMHACGHDVHITCLIGTARMLMALRDRWSGTLVLIGQPAEERLIGARAMLTAGLYRRFPTPDYALALHAAGYLPAGTVGVLEGYTHANSDTVEIVVRGIGGHGAFPHEAKDPVVLAARIVLTLQTIVSRETKPMEPCVVTVGTIHGGTKANIIPDEVKLELTLRSYSDSVRAHTIEAIKRICRGEAISTGLPEELFPIVTVLEERVASNFNDPALVGRVRATFHRWLGAEGVRPVPAVMGAEDFSEFGRTVEKVPLCFFRLGMVDPVKFAEHEQTGLPLPPAHSGKFAPLPEPTIKTGVTAMTGAVLELLGPSQRHRSGEGNR